MTASRPTKPKDSHSEPPASSVGRLRQVPLFPTWKEARADLGPGLAPARKRPSEFDQAFLREATEALLECRRRAARR